jgi:two-component system NarL family sensor kinase
MLARIGKKYARLSRVESRIEEASKSRSRSERRGSIITEIEKERARIARELHAGAGQPLAGIKINLELLESGLLRNGPEPISAETRELLARLNRLAEAALGQVRAVSHRLHPPDWQELSVEEALEFLVRESGVTGMCETSLKLGPLSAEPPHAVKVVLYRCAQECLSNVLRHSRATRFELSLSESDSWILMNVGDNGQGIPEDAARRGGIGLASIQEHALSAGGRLEVSSGALGTTIQIGLPLEGD